MFFLVTRRHRALAVAVGVALGASVASWAVLGFGEIARWWHLVGVQTSILYRQAYGLIALACHLGADRAIGEAVVVVVSVALACACAWFGRRRADREAFTITVGDAHRLTARRQPLLRAAARADRHQAPRLSGPLLLGLIFWLCPATAVTGWEAGLAWLLVAAIAAWLLKPIHAVQADVCRSGGVAGGGGSASLARSDGVDVLLEGDSFATVQSPYVDHLHNGLFSGTLVLPP